MSTSTAARRHHAVQELPTRAYDWRPAVNLARSFEATVGSGPSVLDELVARIDPHAVLPETVRNALGRFRRDPGPSGALLLRGVPRGRVPATPERPTSDAGKDLVSETVLLTVARALGEPIGYRAEHGGALVQNLLPVRAAADAQTSTSSAVDLEFHTETAFHPHRSHYLLLGCLRGDPAARTYLCSIREILDDLDAGTRRVLSDPRFRTRVDESFGGSPDLPPGPPVAVLQGDRDAPTLVFDAELMTGIDAAAGRALATLRHLATTRRLALILEPGDLLVIDNHTCIHGRSAFPARYDGTDRWLQRAFVVDDLARSAADRSGRTIDTRFA